MGIIGISLGNYIANHGPAAPEAPVTPARLDPDRLAWHNDGGEFEDYPGPRWQEDEPRPTAPPDYVPTPEEMAEWSGYTLARSGEGPGDLDDGARPSAWLAHVRGQVAGAWEREEEEWIAEHDRIMAAWEPAGELHDCEARGVC